MGMRVRAGTSERGAPAPTGEASGRSTVARSGSEVARQALTFSSY